jgi:HEAT repeat protein
MAAFQCAQCAYSSEAQTSSVCPMCGWRPTPTPTATEEVMEAQAADAMEAVAPASIPSPPSSSKSSNVWLWLGLGALTVLLVCGGGVTAVGYMVVRSVRRAAQTITTGLAPVQSAQQALDELQGSDQIRQIQALAYLQTAAPEPALQPQIARELVRLAGSESGMIGPQAAEVLVIWAAPAQMPDLIKLAAQASFPINHSAIKAMVRLKDPRAVPCLVAGLENPRIQAPAADALIALGPAAAETEVRECLQHNDPTIRNRAARILQKWGKYDASDVFAEQLSKLNNPVAAERQDALRWLASAKPDAERRQEAAKDIALRLNDDEMPVRAAAAKALAVWGSKAQVPELLEALKSSRDHPERLAIIDALGKLGDQRAAAPIAARLTDRSDRSAAAQALIAIGTPAETEVLKYLDHADAPVRVEAQKILKSIGTAKTVAELERRVARLQNDKSAAARTQSFQFKGIIDSIKQRTKT